MQKRIVPLLVMCIMISFIAGMSVSSSSLLESISVYLNKEVKLTLRGTPWEARINGQTLHPITHEGSTYLPVRAVAEALDTPIRWESETKSVHIAEAFEVNAAYSGVVEAQTFTTGGTSDNRDYGTGSVRFVPESDGKVTLVIYGSVNEEGDVNMGIPGRHQSGGWSSEASETVEVMIDVDGNILGEGVLNEGLPSKYRIKFNGQVLPESLQLEVTMESQAESDGLDFVFNFELARIVTDDSPAEGEDVVIKEPPSGSSEGLECTRTVWQPRNVFNFSGPMQMIMVPVCAN